MARLTDEFKDRLHLVFDHYCVAGREGLRFADLTQLSQEMGIVPALLTPREAAGLFRWALAESIPRMSPREEDTAALPFPLFMQWLAGAAQLAYSKPAVMAEYGRLFPVGRVRELALHLISHPSFARIERANQFHLVTAAHEQQAIEVRLAQYVDKMGLSGEMDRIYSHYCNHGEEEPGDTMKPAMWARFLRDCSLLDSTVGYEHIDLIFLQAVLAPKGPAPEGKARGSQAGVFKKPRMNQSEFYKALGELARRKLPAQDPFSAACALLTRFVMPKAKRTPEAVRVEWGSMPEVWDIFLHHNGLLHLLFERYSDKKDATGRGLTHYTSVGEQDPLQGPKRLRFHQFAQFAKEFDLYRSLSHMKLLEKFRSVVAARATSYGTLRYTAASGGERGREDLSFDEFATLLLSCAVDPGEISSVAPALAARCVEALIEDLQNADALKELELWRNFNRPARSDLKPLPIKSPMLKGGSIRVHVAPASHQALSPHTEGLTAPVGNDVTTETSVAEITKCDSDLDLD